MPPDQLLVFLTVTLLLSASPGPVMLSAMANGGIYGVRHALWGMVGATVGNLSLIALSIAGMALVLQSSEMLFRIIQWAGAAYLVWLGLKIARQSVEGEFATGKAMRDSGWQLFIKSFGIAVSNPKGLLYFGALFPQFISPARALLPQLSLLVGLFVVIDLISMLIYAKSGSFIVSWLRSPQHRKWFNRIAGGALIAAGIAMAIL
ncbi:MAG: LysE family translocator [Cellvibrionaceae bacterium]|nr:LysE family translocator [Cellvibrionaceae bacterium]